MMTPDGDGGAPPEQVRIGAFVFDEALAVLLGPGGTQRLEDRAARTLALLCAARGAVVPQAVILERVWQGRAVSANSVAVVIRDLRRALGDDARNPALLLTVPKRGYRLIWPAPDPAAAVAEAPAEAIAVTGAVAPAAGGRGWRARLTAAAALLAVCAVVVLGVALRRPAAPVLLLRPVVNDTGIARYDRTARALGDLVQLRLSRVPGLRIGKDGKAGRFAALTATLIMWNGQPTLSLSETDARSGTVLWAAMAEGPEEKLAGNTLARLDDFAARGEGRAP